MTMNTSLVFMVIGSTDLPICKCYGENQAVIRMRSTHFLYRIVNFFQLIVNVSRLLTNIVLFTWV